MKPGKTGIVRILNAFKYSYDGFKSVIKSEAAFRQELVLCIVLAIVIIFLPKTIVGKLFLISTIFAVIAAELINSAIEAVVDRVSDEIHPLSKVAKDIGSLLVLISFIYMFIIWIVVLFN